MAEIMTPARTELTTEEILKLSQAEELDRICKAFAIPPEVFVESTNSNSNRPELTIEQRAALYTLENAFGHLIVRPGPCDDEIAFLSTLRRYVEGGAA